MVDNYYTIKQLKEMLSLSKSQIYKLLKNESGVIDKGVKKYNEDILFSLMYKKIKRKRNGL
jgi:predicted transcriptional regulator